MALLRMSRYATVVPGVVGSGMYALATAILVFAAPHPDSASITASEQAIATAAASRRAATASTPRSRGGRPRGRASERTIGA